MAKSYHSKSCSEFKTGKHKNSLSLVPSFDKPQASQLYNAQVFTVKHYKKLVPTESRLYSKLKEPKFKRKKKDAYVSTEPCDEKSKQIALIETALKQSKNSGIGEKLKVAVDVLAEISKLDSQFGQLMTGIKNIIESFVLKHQEQSATIQCLQEELVEDRQSLKIFKKRFKKLALENLNLSQNLTEFEEKYRDIKMKCRDLRVKLKEQKGLITSLEENRENILKDLNFYIRWGKALKDISNFEEFIQFKEKFRLEKQEKESDIMNVSSIEVNSDAYRDSHNIKSQSSFSVILF